jgi:hypothetical protein
MKRIVLALSLATFAAAAAGCSENGPKMNSPFKKKDASTSPAKANYFELRKEGKTYVLGSPDSLKRFNGGQIPAVRAVDDLGGKTVYFESRGMTEFNRLVADYKKQHNLS